MDKEVIYSMLSPPPPTALAREYIISAFALHIILCLKIAQLFLLSGKLEVISIDVIGISTLYLYILEEKWLKLNIVSHIPGSKMESILYPLK